MAAGCGKAPSSQKEAAKKPETKIKQVINTGPAFLTRYTKLPKREKSWYIEWKRAALDYTEGDPKQGGDMEVVSGTLYKEGNEASVFAADHGHANKETGVLTLMGNAVVRAKSTQGLIPTGKKTASNSNSEAVMRCDQVDWDPEAKIVKAKGHVNFVGNGYTFGMVPELWCSPDLTHVATPDLYLKS